MNDYSSLSTILPVTWIAQHKLLTLASLILLTELALRQFFPRSAGYAAWTAFFQGLGGFWTAIILSTVYLLSVGPISLVLRLRGRDPLDRAATPEPSFWRAHEPHPLGPQVGARHQF